MKKTFAISLLSALVLAASANAAVTDVTVNGQKITAAAQEQVIQGAVAQGAQRNAQLENAVRQQMIGETVLLQEAKKQNIESDKRVQEALSRARTEILSQAVIQKYMKAHPVTDAEIKSVYDKQKAAYGSTEYHVRHILVADKAEADKVVSRVKGGEDFAKVAKEVSKDPGTKANGGDLDWISPASMVPQFGAAVKSQKVNEIGAPVQTQFGFHVVQVLATRPAQLFPQFERAKGNIARGLANERAGKYVQELVSKASVK